MGVPKALDIFKDVNCSFVRTMQTRSSAQLGLDPLRKPLHVQRRRAGIGRSVAKLAPELVQLERSCLADLSTEELELQLKKHGKPGHLAPSYLLHCILARDTLIIHTWTTYQLNGVVISLKQLLGMGCQPLGLRSHLLRRHISHEQ